jgi:hypothetical protein
MKIQPGVGYIFDSSSKGFTLDTSEQFPDRDTFVLPPLNPQLDGNKVSVSPGTVNRYIPKLNNIYIDAATPPTITAEGPGFICVKCTYEAGKFFPRTATIVFEYGATPPVDTNTESYYPLARVNETTVDGVNVLSLVRLVEPGNLAVNRLKAGASTATWWWTRV